MDSLINNKKRRFYLACLASILVVVILAITGFLNLSSFEKNYIDSLVSSYRVAGGEAKRTIEYSVKFHKPLDNYAGMGDVLTSIKGQIPTVKNVFLLSTDGQVLYDTAGPIYDKLILSEKFKKLNFSHDHPVGTEQSWLYIDGFYHALLPLYAASGEWMGTIDIFFDDAIVKEQLLDRFHATLKIMALIVAITILANLIILFRLPLFREDGQFNVRGVTMALATVLTFSQLAFAANNVVTLRSTYIEVIHSNLNIASNMIASRINHVVSLGLSYQELNGVDSWLNNLVSPLKEVDRVEVFSGGGPLLFKSSSKDDGSGKGDLVSKELVVDRVGQSAALKLTISEKYLQEKVFRVVLDAGTMFVTSLFFLVELLNFSIILLGKFDHRNVNAESTSPVRLSLLSGLRSRLLAPRNVFHDEKTVRVLSFLLLLSGYMSVSFIPLIMKEIYKPFWGVTESFAVGIPIMSEMFGAFISSLFVGHFIDRYGWRPIFSFGLLLMASGTVVSGLTDDLFLFILVRAFSGLGYGAAWMGLRGLVATGDSDSQRSRGFSLLNAGIFSGQNCGAVLGALLAERIGFSNVFLIAGMLIFFAYPVAYFYVENKKPSSTGSGKGGLKRIGKFVFGKENIYFFVLIVIPSAIVGTFLNYFFPLFSKAHGISQGDIGRGFLLYGVCIVFIGPVLVKFLREKLSNQYVIVLASLIAVLGLTIFGVIPTFGGALFAIVILGLADAIGLSSQNSYFINQESTRDLGHGKALSLFSAVKKVGQLSGPAVFGLTASLGASLGIGVVAAIYLIAALCFTLYIQSRNSEN